MAKKEFDNLTGKLKPDAYKPPATPKPKLSKTGIMVLMLKRTKEAKLHLNNWWIIIKAIFTNEALNQLQGKPSLITTALSARYTLLFIGGVVVLFLIITLFK